MNLLAIDPSIRSCGWAYFTGRQLAAAGRVSQQGKHASVGNAINSFASAVVETISNSILKSTSLAWSGFEQVNVVWELPQIYRASKSKGDPNDLLKTAAIGAAITANLKSCCTVVDVKTPTPAQWAGQTKKVTKGDAWKSQRGQMIWRRLSAQERAKVPNQHDAIDAVGLGLWALVRFEPIRVNAGASEG